MALILAWEYRFSPRIGFAGPVACPGPSVERGEGFGAGDGLGRRVG
jgi:hypothetical protein